MSDYSDVLSLEPRPHNRAALYVIDRDGEPRTIFADLDDLTSHRAFRKRCTRSGVKFGGKHLAPVWVMLMAKMWKGRLVTME